MPESGKRTEYRSQHQSKPTAASVSGSARPKQTRFSREETRNRILDAAEELFSRRDPSKVTVREIAEAAGVTHPLVHQYVGSKPEILDAVIARGAPQRLRIMTEHPVYREIVPVVFEDVLDRKVHTRSIIRSAMDGIEYAPIDDRMKNGQMLLVLARQAMEDGAPRQAAVTAVDPRIVLAATTALACGWTAMEDLLLPMFELEDQSSAEIRSELISLVQQLLELVFPPVPECGSGED